MQIHPYKVYFRSAKFGVELIYEFINYEMAHKYVLDNGKKITNDFFNDYKQGCSFCILQIDNTMDGYTIFVFSENSYNMVMNEHIKMVQLFLADPIPNWIVYIKNNTIFYGCNNEFFEKILNIIDKKYHKKYIEEFEKYQIQHKQNHVIKCPIKDLFVDYNIFYQLFTIPIMIIIILILSNKIL